MESIVGGARLESLGHEALLQPQPVSSFYTSTGPDCRVRGTLCSNCVLCKLTYTNAILKAPSTTLSWVGSLGTLVVSLVHLW